MSDDTTSNVLPQPARPSAGSPIEPPTIPYAYAASPDAEAARARRWNATKTAVVAGVALVLTSAGAIGAAAAVPSGTGGGDVAPRVRMAPNQVPGGAPGSGFGPRSQQNGSQLPNLQTDPNQTDPNAPQQVDPNQQTSPDGGGTTDGDATDTTLQTT